MNTTSRFLHCSAGWPQLTHLTQQGEAPCSIDLLLVAELCCCCLDSCSCLAQHASIRLGVEVSQTPDCCQNILSCLATANLPAKSLGQTGQSIGIVPAALWSNRKCVMPSSSLSAGHILHIGCISDVYLQLQSGRQVFVVSQTSVNKPTQHMTATDVCRQCSPAHLCHCIHNLTEVSC